MQSNAVQQVCLKTTNMLWLLLLLLHFHRANIMIENVFIFFPICSVHSHSDHFMDGNIEA